MPDFDEIIFFKETMAETTADFFKGWFSGAPCTECGNPAFFSWGRRDGASFSHDFDIPMQCTNPKCGVTRSYSNTLIREYRLANWALKPGN